MKPQQRKLLFPPDDRVCLEERINDDPMLRVSEIEISYHPAVRPSERISVTGSQEAEQVFRRIWCRPIELRECFYALFLSRANKVLGYYLVPIGGITRTVIDVRTVYQAALKANACSVIFAHCHPSGNSTPSDADIQITRKLIDAGKFLDISVLDHLILLPEGYFSMADNGMI